MTKMMSFPVGNAHIEKAVELNTDAIIGVTICLLVTPEDFDRLPEMFREQAREVYAAPRDEGRPL